MTIFLVNLFAQYLQLVATQYLIVWAKDYTDENRWVKFGIYASFNYSFVFLNVFRFIFMLILGIKASRRTHSSMVFRLLHSPVEEFIEKVSAGRLINRFSKDMDVLDKSVFKSTGQFILCTCIIIIDGVFMVYQLDYYVLIPLFVYIVISIGLQRTTMTVKRESIRLEAISKSPIVSWTTETIRGLPQIRSSDKTSFATKNMIELLHANMVNSITSAGLDAWFKLRIAMASIFIVQIPCFLYMLFYHEDISVQKLSLFMLIVTGLSSDILQFLTFVSDFESNMIAIERINYFEMIPHEPHYYQFDQERKKYLYLPAKIDLRKLTCAPSDKIVKQGEVVFNMVTARYGEDAEPVLKDLDFKVAPGEKIGIVGRTGAGKSSLIKLFWMSLSPSEGQVLIDGVDIAKVDLKTLRNEVMVIS